MVRTDASWTTVGHTHGGKACVPQLQSLRTQLVGSSVGQAHRARNIRVRVVSVRIQTLFPHARCGGRIQHNYIIIN